MKRQINYTFLCAAILGMVILAGMVHVLHGFQMGRNADLFRDQADAARGKGDLALACRFYDRYLRLTPSDTESMVKFGEALDELGKKQANQRQRAYFVFEKVLTMEPERSNLRERCIELAMESLNRPSDAKDHLEILLKKAQEREPRDLNLEAELEHKLGICSEEMKDKPGAGDWYMNARDHAPAELKHYLRLAHVYQELLDQPKKARETLKDMVARNARNPRAHLERARILLGLAAFDKKLQAEAAEAIEDARALVATDEKVFLYLAQLARLRGDANEARKHYYDGINIHPKSLAMYFALIRLEVNEKKLDKALQVAEPGLKPMPGEKALLFAPAELLLEKGDVQKTGPVIDQLVKAGYSDILTDYLTARMHVQKAAWSEAEQILDRIRPKVTIEKRVLLGGVDFLLGLCYERLGNPDQALFVYLESVKHDPGNLAARVKVAQTYVNLDRLEEAIREYQQILAFAKVPVGVDQMLARVLIQQALRLPSRQRRWDVIRDHLDRAAKTLPDSADVPLLRAEVILLENPSKKDEARRLLEKARDAQPDRVEFWLGLAYLAGRDGPDKGLAVLVEAERNPKIKGRVEIPLARMNFLARQPAKDALPVLKLMEKEAQSRPEEERNRLLTALARAFYICQDIDDATRLWKQVALAQPQNLGLRLILCDLALYFNKGPEADRWITDTRKLEGENGTFWRYGQAYRFYQQAKPKENEPPPPGAAAFLTQARAMLEEVGKRRPSWHAAAALEGQIDDLEGGRSERAIDNLLRAVNLGDRRSVIIRRLVELLLDRKRFGDAERAIRKLIDQEQTLLAAGLGRIAVQALLRSEEVDRALELALKSVPSDSKSYKDHLWLGQILFTVGKKEDATRELAAACELGPRAAETWETYVYYLASVEQKKEAEAVLLEAQKKLPKNELPLTLATCYTVLGKNAEAEKQYRLALANPPKGRNVPRELADFYLKTAQLEKAEPMIRGFIEAVDISPEQKAWARRNLAVILGSRAEYLQFKKALALLEENHKLDPNSPADQRARAVLMGTHLGHRREAIFLLEDLNRIEPLSHEERFLLVKLYSATGNRSKLRRHIITLVNSPDGKKPLYYAYYVQLLLQLRDLDDAAAWLKELEALAPTSPLTSELQIRLAHTKGQHDKAAAMIRDFAERKEENLHPAALLFDEFSRTVRGDLYRKPAEEFYRRWLDKAPADKGFVEFAYFLSRNERVGEALDQCEKAMARGSPETALTAAVGILRGNSTAREYFSRVEGLIQKRLQDNRRPASLWNILADLYDLQGRHGEAITLYRRVLAVNADNFLALNNLAWLLALRDKNPESLELTQRLLELAGPVPEFHDTRGVIFLTFEKHKEALHELEEAAERSPTAATWFHLAQAHLQAQNKTAARKAWQKAQDAGLRPAQVHPLERDQLRHIETMLAQK